MSFTGGSIWATRIKEAGPVFPISVTYAPIRFAKYNWLVKWQNGQALLLLWVVS